MVSNLELRAQFYVAVTLAAVVVGTRVGIEMGFPPTNVSTFWPANAILLAALLLMGDRHRKQCLLLAFAAYFVGEFWGRISFGNSFFFSLANCLEVSIALFLIRRYGGPRFDFSKISHLFVFVLAALAASVASSLVGAGFIALTGGPLFETVFVWCLGDVIGLIVFTPLILTLPAWRGWWTSAGTSARVETALLGALLIGVSFTVYGPHLPRVAELEGAHFLPIPIMVFVALRLGPKGASVSALVVSLIAWFFAIEGHGPFADLTPERSVESLQLFITSLVLATLAIAILMKERNAAVSALVQSNNLLEDRVRDRTRELSESESHLQALTDALPVLISYVDAEHRYRRVNRAYEEWFGHPRSWILGRHTKEVIGEAAYRNVQGKIERALAGETLTFESAMPCAAGGTRQIRASYVPDLDEAGEVKGFFVVVTDLSDLRAEALKRERAEESLKVTKFSLDQAGDAVFWVGEDGRFKYMNRSGHRLLGYSREELSSLHIWDLEPEIARDIWPTFWKRAIDLGPDHSETTYLTKEGSSVSVAVMTTPVCFGDRLVLCIICRDLSERHRMETKLHQAQRLEAVGQLTGGVAHDFNNLLASISLDADLLAERAVFDVKGRMLAEHIGSNVERGQSLTARLLGFSRQQSLSPRTSDVSGLIESLEELLGRTLGASIELSYERTPDVWPALIDPHQFEQALVNLALNARDAMPDGGPLQIETRNAVIDEAYADQHEEVTAGDYVEVTVRDAGTGMPPAVLAKAFEPFFTTKDVGKGSGLGLSMAYGFVKQSNGHITIESDVDKGTTVTLFLPRCRGVQAGSVTHDKASDRSVRPQRILVVEDDPEVREISASVLRESGYQVTEAGSGREAIHCLEKEGTFDLLFTDVVLPGGRNGGEVAVRAERLQPGIKVLYTSGFAGKSLPKPKKEDEGLGLLKKPWNQEELLESVREALNSDAAP